MAKVYRATQQWNHWLNQPLGHVLLEAEQQFLFHLLAKYGGKYAALLGVPHQSGLLTTAQMSHRLLVSPLINKDTQYDTIESEFYELPILPGSLDLVIVPHTLEYIDNPQRLLAEACRIVKPEGHIVILGFNSYSPWRVKKTVVRHFINTSKIKKWLSLADFKLLAHQTFWYPHLSWLEWIGQVCHLPFGGVYALVAQAKVIPLTPIRLHWKQQLSGIPSMPMRNTP